MSDVLASLKAVFPDIEDDVLSMMLEHHGSVERVVEALLDEGVGDAPPDATTPGVTDEDMAHALQQELDEEVAQALQRELDAERQRAASSAAPTTTPIAAVAAERVAAAAAGTKRLGSWLHARLNAKTNRGGQSERLLDISAAPTEINQPLSSPLFSPSAMPPQQYSAPSAPMMQATTSSTRASAEEASGVAESSVSIGATTSPSDTPSRYTSRVERARRANSARLTPSSFDRPLPSALAPLVASPAAMVAGAPAALVPVGELI